MKMGTEFKGVKYVGSDSKLSINREFWRDWEFEKNVSVNQNLESA